jgi:hypothetical protein
LSIIQEPFSITKCQTLISRFATCSSLYRTRFESAPHAASRAAAELNCASCMRSSSTGMARAPCSRKCSLGLPHSSRRHAHAASVYSWGCGRGLDTKALKGGAWPLPHKAALFVVFWGSLLWYRQGLCYSDGLYRPCIVDLDSCQVYPLCLSLSHTCSLSSSLSLNTHTRAHIYTLSLSHTHLHAGC